MGRWVVAKRSSGADGEPVRYERKEADGSQLVVERQPNSRWAAYISGDRIFVDQTLSLGDPGFVKERVVREHTKRLKSKAA